MESCITVEVAPLKVCDSVSEQSSDVAKWSRCIYTEYPIISVDKINNGKVILHIGPQNQGYTIYTQLKDDILNGEAILQTPNKIVIAEFNYDKGSMTGPCKLYYDSGELFFEGSLVNGYRQGMGMEYDKNGNVLFQGIFIDGYKGNRLEKLEDTKGYWKETDFLGNIVSICKKDDHGCNHGICYFFENGLIEHASMYKNNKEISLLYKFHDDEMIEYKNGVRVYEGTYYGSVKSGFFRYTGKEYDKNGQLVVYEGDFLNGKRNGFGTSYSNNIKRYEGIWTRGYPERRFKIIYIIIILVFALLCYSFIFFFFMFYSLLVYLPLCIIYALFLILIIYKFSPKSTITKDCKPKYSNAPIIGSNGIVQFNTQGNLNIKIFRIDGYTKMVQLNVKRSINLAKSKKIKNKISKSFHLVNCKHLESINIEIGNFYDFGGQFELRNLPSLKFIKIGLIKSKSLNFFWSSFVIQGMSMTLN